MWAAGSAPRISARTSAATLPSPCSLLGISLHHVLPDTAAGSPDLPALPSCRAAPRAEAVYILYGKQFNGPANSSVAPMHKDSWRHQQQQHAQQQQQQQNAQQQYPQYQQGGGYGSSYGSGNGGGGRSHGPWVGPGGGGGGSGPTDDDMFDWARDIRAGKAKGTGRRGKAAAGRAAAADAGGYGGGGFGEEGGAEEGPGHWITRDGRKVGWAVGRHRHKGYRWVAVARPGWWHR